MSADLLYLAIASTVISVVYVVATLTGRWWGDDGGAINDDDYWCSCPKCERCQEKRR